jgi:hypothetical protein
MKKFTLCIIMLASILTVKSQVTITATDMPKPGDTLRTSVTAILEGIDYQATGENFTWDFTGLTVMYQRIDTFVSVASTPMIYQAVFNNQFIFPDYKATVAKKIQEFGLIPNMQITDSYQFFKESTGDYREVGAGVTIAGAALPIMYQQIDTLYRFPLQYGNSDSAHSSFNIDVPDLGYVGFIKKRVNHADGWGTLITPYGEYQALRVKTEMEEYDTIFIDSLNTGFPLNRVYTEYKWFANGFCLPLLQVNEEALMVTAAYVDSVRTNFVGVGEQQSQDEFNFNVFPNPASEYISISYELLNPSRVDIAIYSIYGKEVKKVMNSIQDHGLYNKLINTRESGLQPGMYLVVLLVDNRPFVKRFLLQ